MGDKTAAESGTERDDPVRKVTLGATEKETPASGGNDGPQEDSNTVPLFDNPVKYDIEQLQHFLDAVFHAGLAEDEQPFVQIHKRAPAGFGSTVDEALNPRLGKTEAPMPAYFSTAGLTYDGALFRHTKDAFKSFRVLVLDDVGTKVPFDRIPEAMAENYLIESSEGNFQLGFILAEPLTDYEEAQAFINLFVDAGYTDGGGAMPVKKVRLPCGVNGKAGARGMFHVKLHHLEGEPWGAQELLDAAGIDVDWEKYRKQIPTREFRTRRLGATAWVPDLYYVNPQTGVYDPVLEFMYSKGMVIQDGQEKFMDVICPFHEEHTEQDLKSKLCGYSPLGHGLYPHKRVFSCFHDSCKAFTSADFIMRLHLLGGPLMPTSEYRPENVVNMVYDTVHDRVYDLMEKGVMYGRQLQVINRITPKVPVPHADGKEKLVDQLPLWLKQPSSVKVAGPVYDASDRSRLVRDSHEQLRVNLFRGVSYDPVTPDPEHVKMFEGFLTYLLPEEDERDYIRKWLACKVQNQAFRGAAVVLVSQAQGTGKNTLMKMIDRLFGGNAYKTVSMEELVGNGQFNEWVMSPFVNVNESLAGDDIRVARRAYNRLKELVDPAPMPMTANPKYGTKIDVMCSTSFLFFSNHLDAVYLHAGDRRFFAASGPDVPAGADYFTQVYDWMARDDWMAHVWWHLMEMEVDHGEMMRPPPRTQTMGEVEFEATSPLEAVIKAAIHVWPAPMVPAAIIKDILPSYVPRGVPDNYRPIAQRMLADRLRSLSRQPKVSRCKGTRVSLKPEYAEHLDDDEWLADAHLQTADAIDSHNEDAFKRNVDVALVEAGFDF